MDGEQSKSTYLSWTPSFLILVLQVWVDLDVTWVRIGLYFNSLAIDLDITWTSIWGCTCSSLVCDLRVLERHLGAGYRTSIEYTRHSRVLLVVTNTRGHKYFDECEYGVRGPRIFVSTRRTLYRGPCTVFQGWTGILTIDSVSFHWSLQV